MGIGETLRQDLFKLVIRAAGYQAKTACGNIQICAGLEAGIVGSTHAVGQQRLERSRARRSEEEAITSDVEADTESVVAVLGNISIDTTGIEEEAEEGLKAALGIEVE